MTEIIANIHPVIQALFAVLCLALVVVIIWCVIVDNALVSSSYDEHAREMETP